MFAKALAVLASISAALAVPLITEPTASSSYVAGTRQTLKWMENGTAPLLAQYGPSKISIYVGNVNQQTLLQTLNASVDVSTVSQLDYVPNPGIGESGPYYFIRIESIGLKDNSSFHYPVMAFSAKFTLTGTNGQFTDAVKAQIAGVSASSSHPSSTGSSPSPSLTTSVSKVLSSATPSSSSKAVSGAESVVFHGSWIGFLISTFLGVAIL